jgi:hypothetical protein
LLQRFAGLMPILAARVPERFAAMARNLKELAAGKVMPICTGVGGLLFLLGAAVLRRASTRLRRLALRGVARESKSTFLGSFIGDCQR